MNDEELRNSEMAYGFKITYHTRGIFEYPCQELKTFEGKEFEGCKTPRRNSMQYPEDWDGKNKDNNVWCFRNCEFSIDVRFLSKKQLEIYIKERPIEKKKLDYSVHPENEKFYQKNPEIFEKVLIPVIKQSK